MSNQVCIQRTTFVDQPNGEKTYGYRMFDDYESTYNNFYGEDFLEKPPLDAIAQIKVDGSRAEYDLFSFVVEEEKGITVDGEYFEWEQIKGLLIGA